MDAIKILTDATALMKSDKNVDNEKKVSVLA